MNRCNECHGIGEVEYMEVRQFGRFQMQWVPCKACNGTGRIATPEPEPSAPVATREVVQVTQFAIDGHTVTAPGFSREQFTAFVERAKAAQLRTTPATTPGTVLVQSGSSPASYAVTRERCSCRGHQSAGRCYHRALAIYLADVEGVNVCRVATIGFSKRGVPLTIGRKPAATPAPAAAHVQEAA